MNKIILTIIFMTLVVSLSFSEEGGIQIHPQVSLNGEFESEFIDSQKDSDLVTNTSSTTNDDNSIPRLQVDRLMLKPKITFSKNLYLEGELEFFGDGTNTLLKEGYGVLQFPSNLFLKVGLDDRFFMNPQERKTEIYPLNGTAFWRDEDVGVTLGGDYASFYWRASITNGLAIREQGVGKNSVYFMLHDNRQIDELTKGDKEYGIGLGLKNVGEKIAWNLMTFGYWSRLRKKMSQTQTVTDVNFLKEVITGYTSDKRDNWFLGEQLRLDLGKPFSFFTQYIYSQDGKIKRQGFYVEPTLTFTTSKREYLHEVELLYRYNILDVKTSGLANNIQTSSFTWDRETHSLAMNIELVKNALWRNEYHFNLEDTGGTPKNVSNNEFLSQLEIRF